MENKPTLRHCHLAVYVAPCQQNTLHALFPKAHAPFDEKYREENLVQNFLLHKQFLVTFQGKETETVHLYKPFAVLNLCKSVLEILTYFNARKNHEVLRLWSHSEFKKSLQSSEQFANNDFVGFKRLTQRYCT